MRPNFVEYGAQRSACFPRASRDKAFLIVFSGVPICENLRFGSCRRSAAFMMRLGNSWGADACNGELRTARAQGREREDARRTKRSVAVARARPLLQARGNKLDG